MKLILASAGISTPQIAVECTKLVGKPPQDITFAVINEGYAVEHGDHGWVLNDLNRIKQHFPGRLQLVNLLALDLTEVRRRIMQADVLMVLGGNTDYLMSVFNETGFGKLLPELLQTKVYVGSSAGAMVLGKRLSTLAYTRLYNEEQEYGVQEYLKLVDCAILPHFNAPEFHCHQSVVLQIARHHKGFVHALGDDAALIVDGDKQRVVGKHLLLFDGKQAG